jgi:hypothetical protein
MNAVWIPAKVADEAGDDGNYSLTEQYSLSCPHKKTPARSGGKGALEE